MCIYAIVINHVDYERIQKGKLYSHTALKTTKHTIKLRLISTVVHPQTCYSFWMSHLRVFMVSIVAGWVECVMPPQAEETRQYVKNSFEPPTCLLNVMVELNTVGKVEARVHITV